MTDAPRRPIHDADLPLGVTHHATADEPAGAWLLPVVFLAGGALMAYEIVGSRLLAPYFGSSTFVWGSLISVFLGALAAGYALGGRLADRRPNAGMLAIILAASAVLVGITVLIADPLQTRLVRADLGARLNPLVASVALFGPASVLIGMVSPFAVRLRAGDIASLGRTAGSLYGLSTAGSIAGTIAASFWLVQSFGSESTVISVGIALAACALVTAVAGKARVAIIAVAVVAMVAVGLLAVAGAGEERAGDRFTSAGSRYSPVYRAGGYTPEYEPSTSGRLREKVDSSYHRIRVVDYDAGQVGDRPARVLHFDNSFQAAAPLEGGDPIVTGVPLFGYLRGLELVPAMRPDAERVLLIGLGSGAYAMRLHELRPELDIDVVEIDPAVVDLARKWFGYRDSENGNPRITTHVGDGRTWLAAQSTDERFDAIVLDTYFADSIPFHLTTREFLTIVRSHLTKDGIAAANLIGAVEGPKSELLRAMHATWADVFDDVALYPVPETGGSVDLKSFTNIELYAAPSRGTLPPRGGEDVLLEQAGFPRGTSVVDTQLREIIAARYVDDLPSDDVRVLTDDLAPVDSLLQVDGI